MYSDAEVLKYLQHLSLRALPHVSWTQGLAAFTMNDHVMREAEVKNFDDCLDHHALAWSVEGGDPPFKSTSYRVPIYKI